MSTKTEFLMVRLDGREKEVYKGLAEQEGVPLASWVRSKLRERATQEYMSQGKKNPFDLKSIAKSVT